MFKKYLLILKSFILKKMIIDLIQFILSLLFIDLPLEDTINKFLDDESSKNKTEKILNKEEIIDKIKEQYPGVESEKIEKLVENVEKKVSKELINQKGIDSGLKWRIIMCICSILFSCWTVNFFFYSFDSLLPNLIIFYILGYTDSLDVEDPLLVEMLERFIRCEFVLFISVITYWIFEPKGDSSKEESKNQEKEDDSINI